MKYTIQKILIIDLMSLSEDEEGGKENDAEEDVEDGISDTLYELYNFNNNSYIEFHSELRKQGDTWKTALTIEKLKSWEFEPLPKGDWKIEKFLINSGIDFEGIEKILFWICW